jgi:tetratricopeptide (TPR) repeat protein
MNFRNQHAFARLATVVTTTTILFASPAVAQNPAATPAAAPAAAGPTCEIDTGRPQAIARGTFSMARAQSAIKTGDPTRDLHDVMSVLSAPSLEKENPVGRAYLLGQAYILLLDRPGVTPITTRSSIGLTTNPTGTIDLFAAADSAWRIVEASSPGCATVGQQWRQQKPWLNVTNEAINALNSNKLDSAEYLAKRALILDRTAPYAYSVLASVAKSKKDYPTASEYWKKTLAAIGTDTTFNDVRDRTLYDIGSVSAARTDAATGAEKKALAREAIKAWSDLLARSTDDMQSTTAVLSLSRMYVAAGDSTSVPKLYAPMIAQPARFGENTLMQAGVVASQHKHPEDAATLFGAVLARNPYQRDALNNLAASYIFTNQYDKVFPIVTRLTDLDPSNPENWMLSAYSYAGLLKTTKPGKLNRQYTDSLVYYNGKADNMPVKFLVTEFSRTSDATTLVGTIENKSAAAKTYPLSVDFLDRAGQVLFTETVSVGPVPPKGTKEFTIKSAKGGVAGYKYKPLV